MTVSCSGSSPEIGPNKVCKSDTEDEQLYNCKHEVGDDDGDTAPKESTEPPTNAPRSKNSGKLKRRPAGQRTGSGHRIALSSRKKPRRVSKVSAAVSSRHCTFSIGERVFARWSDSRKFKATIKSVLENDMYGVMFEDGFSKICKSQHITRIKRPLDTSVRQEPEATDKSFPALMVTVKVEPSETEEPPQLTSLAQFQIPQVVTLSELPEVPQQGEWCCHWYNDYPVGESTELDLVREKTWSVVVPDWRLPEGWTKHIHQRLTSVGRMEVVLLTPNGKPLRSRQEVKQYLAATGGTYDTATYDFGLHKKRAKALGFYQYTQEYKDAFLSKPAAVPELTNTEINIGSVRVKVIDNLLQCPEPDCLKTFRKENHLQIHIKHYHKELAKDVGEIPNAQDLATLRTPVESLDTPIKIARRSVAGGLKMPSAVIKEDRKNEALQIKSEPGSEVNKSRSQSKLAKIKLFPVKKERRSSSNKDWNRTTGRQI
ncbi:uncharacterized protein LOC128269207 [Anopheles cruzii]|uniref:uncharacterized protein LOC128269207 n=1 Tax=Anopheles cruzii TaxID=68878 RepID=UPI0022EC4754|nr:uncharacterized protein LOC128269207 [Anopheles cruzii]